MVTLIFAFLQPKADLGANLVATILGTIVEHQIPLFLKNSRLPDDELRIGKAE